MRKFKLVTPWILLALMLGCGKSARQDDAKAVSALRQLGGDLKEDGGKVIGANLRTDAELAHLDGLPNLRQLILSGKNFYFCDYVPGNPEEHCKFKPPASNEITDAGFQQVANRSNLRNLAIVNGGVTNSGFSHLKTLSELRELRLLGVHIMDSGMANIADLTKLQVLHLETLHISDSGLAHLKGLNNLEELVLSELTGVTDKGLEYVESLQNLKRIEVSAIRAVTPAGMERLKKALPNAQFGTFGDYKR